LVFARFLRPALAPGNLPEFPGKRPRDVHETPWNARVAPNGLSSPQSPPKGSLRDLPEPPKGNSKDPPRRPKVTKNDPNGSQRYLKRLGIQGSLQTAPGTLRVSEKAASGPPRAPKKQSQKSQRPLTEAQQSPKNDPKNQNLLTNIAHVQGEKERKADTRGEEKRGEQRRGEERKGKRSRSG